MSDTIHIDSNTRAGTIGGTILVILLNLFANDIIRTIGFAALGATVSFFVSFGWKHLMQFLQRRRKKDRGSKEEAGPGGDHPVSNKTHRRG